VKYVPWAVSRKSRAVVASLLADGNVHQLAGERHQLLEPERLVAKLGAQLLDLVRLRVVQVVVAGDDGDRRIRQPGNRADRAEELKAAGQRHPEVEDDGVGPVRLREAQPFVGRQCGPHLIAFQTKHSRKCIGDADVVVNDEDTGDRLVGRGRGHRVIVRPGFEVVKRSRAIFSPFARRISFSLSSVRTRVGGCVSPILVRPVREQLEHDRIIRLLQSKYKRKFEVVINPGNEQAAPVGGPPPWYPDLVLQDARGKKLLGVVEVETAESVNHLEAMSQWAAFSRLRTPFHLYVPVSMIDVARRLCQDMQIPVGEVWAYSMLGDQLRFNLVQRSAQAPESKPRAGAPAPRASASPARATTGQSRAKRPVASAGRRKPAAKNTARAASPARRAATRTPAPRAARGAAKKSAAASRAQKRK